MFFEEIENLGHRTMSHPPNLTVQLRDYQLGTVSWMVDQECLPGGIDRHLWAPVRISSSQCLWYSPCLDKFRDTKPRCNVAGGFLADEMGLGKTVMILGLCLANPAPPRFLNAAAPQNPLLSVADTPTEMEQDDSTSNSSTPLIRSRATLVVCNVSLVGQWFDEASSKANVNIYKYYGNSRKRVPEELANADIVVTTYNVLISDISRENDLNKSGDTDDSFKSSKGSGSNAKKEKGKRVLKPLPEGEHPNPTSMVHWWRIVLDESHAIKDPTSSSNKAVCSLMSGRRWVCD